MSEEQNIINEYMSVFFHHQWQMKMYHFETKFYGAHKASDKYLAKFLANFDRFMEAYQGIYGTINVSDSDIKLKYYNDDRIMEHVQIMRGVFNAMDRHFGNNKDLLAIRDEMLADLNQFVYLLQFALKQKN